MSNYFLFLDESGDHGLVNIDPGFPVFVLCGILISEDSYIIMNKKAQQIKSEFWGDKIVIFHSRDIRKCEKEFSILFDLELKSRFLKQINGLVEGSNYSIISTAIDKIKYIQKYGRLSDDVYEIALSLIIERAVFFLDDIKENSKSLKIVIEKRGKLEDKKLNEHFQRLKSRGTGYVQSQRLLSNQIEIVFKNKKENENGLQLADLIAYPIARYVLEPERANPAFDIFAEKFYSKRGKRYGLKVFP
jgi:hypothetical protein